jgi:hypothetical protein
MNAAPEPAPYWLIFAIIGGFLVVFPLFWCFVVWLISHVGGWQRLSKRYAAGNRPVTGARHNGIQGMVGVASYRGTLTLHFNADGFFVEVMPLFKIGHPRLFIPWTDISARKEIRLLWWKSERLSIGNPAVATITLPAALLEQHQPRG